jgi:multidrug efflux system membrane fusion protein
MKRVIYVVIFLAAAAALYAYAYPRLAGVTAAHAQQAAASGTGGGNGAGSGAAGKSGRSGGGFATAVVTAVAQRQDVPITKSAVGFIEPVNTVVVRSRADGTITKVGVEEGQTVKAGDLLFQLDDRAVEAQIAKDKAQIAKDQANADAAEATRTREEDLVKRGADPQSNLDAAVAAAKAAEATIAVDQAALQADEVTLSYMTITAPIDGRVGTVNTSAGNVVHAADTSAGGLVTITQMSPLRVSFTIAEGDLDRFRQALAGQPQGLPVDIRAPGDTDTRATGSLKFIDSSVDTSSGTIVIKADVDNSAQKLWPGQYVTATTRLGEYANATTIPLQAVQQGSGGPYVFTVAADGKAQKTPVTVIAAVADTAVVGPQLKPGDHVVIEGQLRLATGSAVRETVRANPTKVAEATAGTTAGAAPDSAAPAGKS